MKKSNKIIYILVILIIIVILSVGYLLITKNGKIIKQEEGETKAATTNGSNSYITTEQHLSELESNALPNITMKYGIHITGGWVYTDIPVPKGYKTVQCYTERGNCSVTISDNTYTLNATNIGTYDVSEVESVYVKFSGPRSRKWHI